MCKDIASRLTRHILTSSHIRVVCNLLSSITLIAPRTGKAAQVFATTANIEGEEMKTLITTLRSGKTDQCQLSLVFGFDVPVQFSMGGDENKASVFLSGYFQPGPDDDEDMGDEEDEYGEYGEEGEDVDDSEDDEDRAALYKQLAMGMGGGLHNDDSDDDEDSEEDSEDDEAESGGRVQQLDSEDEEDDEEDSEDEALDEEFISKMIQKNAKGSSTGGSGSKSVEKAMKALAASEPPAKKAKHEGGGSKGQQKGGDKKSAKDSKHGKSGDKRKR